MIYGAAAWKDTQMAGIHCQDYVATAMGGTMYPVFSLDRLVCTAHRGASVQEYPEPVSSPARTHPKGRVV